MIEKTNQELADQLISEPNVIKAVQTISFAWLNFDIEANDPDDSFYELLNGYADEVEKLNKKHSNSSSNEFYDELRSKNTEFREKIAKWFENMLTSDQNIELISEVFRYNAKKENT